MFKTWKSRILFIFCAAILIFITRLIFIETESFEGPKYERVSIEDILDKPEFTKEDYHTLTAQTGLGEIVINDLKRESENFKADMLAYQEQFYTNGEFDCEFIFFPTTRQESLKGEPYRLVPVKDGDIIITRNTHTLGWRHGHAAIVTDAEQGETLEHILLGSHSTYQPIEKWTEYPSVLILRVKEDKQELCPQIARYASENLYDIPYSPFAGLKCKDKSKMDRIDSTHCSHLVWQAFAAFGIDTDSDGGWLVTPKDIANSPELELVQAIGFDPFARWE